MTRGARLSNTKNDGFILIGNRESLLLLDDRKGEA